MPRRRQKDQPDYYCLLSVCVCVRVRARTSVRAYVFVFFLYMYVCVCAHCASVGVSKYIHVYY